MQMVVEKQKFLYTHPMSYRSSDLKAANLLSWLLHNSGKVFSEDSIFSIILGAMDRLMCQVQIEHQNQL